MSLDLKSLVSAFKKIPGIRAVYLFGSQARGDARPSSDIDLALLMDHSPSLDAHAEIVSICMRILQTSYIDVVILNDASPMIKYEVVSEGVLIYKKITDEELNDFESRVIRIYFDTAYLRRIQNDYLRERLMEKGHGL